MLHRHTSYACTHKINKLASKQRTLATVPWTKQFYVFPVIPTWLTKSCLDSPSSCVSSKAFRILLLDTSAAVLPFEGSEGSQVNCPLANVIGTLRLHQKGWLGSRGALLLPRIEAAEWHYTSRKTWKSKAWLLLKASGVCSIVRLKRHKSKQHQGEPSVLISFPALGRAACNLIRHGYQTRKKLYPRSPTSYVLNMKCFMKREDSYPQPREQWCSGPAIRLSWVSPQRLSQQSLYSAGQSCSCFAFLGYKWITGKLPTSLPSGIWAEATPKRNREANQ